MIINYITTIAMFHSQNMSLPHTHMHHTHTHTCTTHTHTRTCAHTHTHTTHTHHTHARTQQIQEVQSDVQRSEEAIRQLSADVMLLRINQDSEHTPSRREGVDVM